jgi:hypothetical protein
MIVATAIMWKFTLFLGRTAKTTEKIWLSSRYFGSMGYPLFFQSSQPPFNAKTFG